jgi:hypothetical protein
MATPAPASRTHPLYVQLAQDAGLQEIVERYPADFHTAVESAMRLRNALPPLDDVAAEPWPPMRARSRA